MKMMERFQNFKIKHLIKKNFTKYIFVSITSFVVDIALFQVFNFFLAKIIEYEAIIISTILARILSSLYNYYFSSHLVFKKYNSVIFKRYFLLVIINMFSSSFLVYLINKHFIDTYAVIIKLVVDAVIFIVNYLIQKKVIFK